MNELPAVVRTFIETQVARGRSVLALDYDGTLAPFQVERQRAVPPARTRDALQLLARAPMTRLAVVSGRPVIDVRALLALEPCPELWGVHGWERLAPDGRCERFASAAVDVALDEAEARVHDLVGQGRIERKSAGLAVHWRGIEEEAATIRTRAAEAWAPLVSGGGLAIRDFDGGVELRATGRDKGTVIQTIVAGAGRDMPIAYLGDDRTDEDAFRALQGLSCALSIHVGGADVTAADVRMPAERVAPFLELWAAATTRAVAQAT